MKRSLILVLPLLFVSGCTCIRVASCTITFGAIGCSLPPPEPEKTPITIVQNSNYIHSVTVR